jgi:hypothetical protein
MACCPGACGLEAYVLGAPTPKKKKIGNSGKWILHAVKTMYEMATVR